MHTLQNNFAFQEIRNAEKIHVHKHSVQGYETFYWDEKKSTGEVVHLECKAVQGRRNIWVKLVVWFKNTYTPTVLPGNGTWAVEPVSKKYLCTLNKFKRSLVIPAEVEERVLCLVDRVEESAQTVLEEKRFHFSRRVIPAKCKEVTSALDYCGQSLQKQIFSWYWKLHKGR